MGNAFKAFPAPDRKAELIDFLDATNVAEATYYYEELYGQSMCGYSHLSLTGTISATTADSTNTITVECSNDEDPVNATWVSVYGYDTKNAVAVNSISSSGTAVTFAWDFDFLNYHLYRIKLVVGDDANTIVIKGRLST